jgi:hypothetical protein
MRIMPPAKEKRGSKQIKLPIKNKSTTSSKDASKFLLVFHSEYQHLSCGEQYSRKLQSLSHILLRTLEQSKAWRIPPDFQLASLIKRCPFVANPDAIISFPCMVDLTISNA